MATLPTYASATGILSTAEEELIELDNIDLDTTSSILFQENDLVKLVSSIDNIETILNSLKKEIRKRENAGLESIYVAYTCDRCDRFWISTSFMVLSMLMLIISMATSFIYSLKV
ncbi:hypothetical protein DFJ63DRAFT_310944 [Scheffersomyces coipomensis]|uniref:uncharacterized protein n=1 Tax=Scheffersomyces coipomensis TaxID=1788519 RepID=UPI00315DE285